MDCDHGPIEMTHWELVHVAADHAVWRCRRCGHEEVVTRE